MVFKSTKIQYNNIMFCKIKIFFLGTFALQGEKMETPREVLLQTLEDLEEKDLKKFKWCLEEEVLKFPGIPKSRLQKAADQMDTVDLMLPYYGIHTIKVTREVLKMIPRNDLEEELSKFPSDPEEFTKI